MACNSCNSCGNNTYGYRTTNVGGIWFPDFVANSCCNPCCAAQVAGVSDETDYVNRINGGGCVRSTGCGCHHHCGCGCGCTQNNSCGSVQGSNTCNCGCGNVQNTGCGCGNVQNTGCGCGNVQNTGCGCSRCGG